MITVDKDKHIYRVDSGVVPSVSDILDTYFEKCPFYTEAGREAGHARHKWYAFLSQGFVTDDTPEADIVDAVNGFKKFMAEVKPEYISGEIPYYHPALRYCGTPDAVFNIGGKLSVMDYKPKAKNKRTMVQTALYCLMLRANGIMVVDRYQLRLYDGLYRMEKYEDPQDMRRAEIMVAAYHASGFYK